MTGTDQNHFIRNAATLSSLCLLLSGCLMGEEDSKSSSDVIADHSLQGSVGDGPVVGASMRILRNDGVELAQIESDANANYRITVQTYAEFYPLSIEARDGTDIVTNTAPDFQLLGAVLEPSSSSVANVNPFTTFAVELARDLPGGINMANLEFAQDVVAAEFNNGLSSLATSGAMTTAIGGGNIAEMIRAAEALGETVRRTRDAMGSSGFSTSGDAVVRALSSDLTDHVVDGDGGSRADARSAAVSTIVSAQVLLETMANELHINGVDATQAMNNAIDLVSIESANPTMADLTVTGEMLSRARVGLVAAFAVTSDPLIDDLLTDLNGIQAGTGSSTIRTFALPSDYRSRLNSAVLLVAGGSDAVLRTVNDISRNRTQITGGENRAPNISGTPATSVRFDEAYSFTPGVSDPDGDALTFSILNMPGWASFNTATGELSGTPTVNDIGTYSNISISVSDSSLTSSLAPFSISVFDDNKAPVISGTPPATVVAGNAYDFTPTASDPEGDALSFSISNMPGWASFNAATGRLSGTPSTNDVGVHGAISITVSDGSLSSTLGPFSIEVRDVASNSAPTIGGTPASNVVEGNSYSFTPTANDADGDALTFSVSGLPSWASFSTSSGQISGTPQSGDVGTYTNILISVSDGQASASLPAFTITVQAVSVGSVTLNWTPPTENTDGTTLTDLAGYKIYWGTTSGSYPNSVTIDNASVSTYVIDNLVSGTYEFVATSFNASGVESSYSNPATKVVQ